MHKTFGSDLRGTAFEFEVFAKLVCCDEYTGQDV